MTVPFAYLKPYIQNKMIKICPAEEVVEFTDVYLSHEFVTVDNEEEFINIFGINLSANIELTGTENDDFVVRVNELGEIEIELEVNLEDTNSYGEFVTVIENEDTDLVVEELSETGAEEVEEPSDEESDISSVKAEVLTEAELEDEEGPEWIVHYDLDSTNESLTESEDDAAPEHVDTITAPDIETAVKYAEQNARMKAREDSKWSDAEVISIKKKEV